MENKNTLFGSYKEYIIIERSDLHQLKDMAKELFEKADNDISNYHKAAAIMDVVKFLKERNIYNREFKIKP
jgi:hypothetical protein